MFNEEGNELEDDLKSSNDSDSIRASRRTRSSISKTKSDHVTNSINKESHLNVLTGTERKKNDKAETHDGLKTVETTKEACDVDRNRTCLQNKSKHATRNTEDVEELPNKNSPRKHKSVLTKSNEEKETEFTLVQNSAGQDINKHSNKKPSRKSASDLTNIMNGKETGCSLMTVKASQRKSVDLTDMSEEMDIQFISEEKFSKKEMDTEHVVRHLCNSDKILRDSPFKSPFKDKYMFSFSPKTDKCHSNISESTSVSECLFKDIHQHNGCSEESTKKSPKLNVPSPKTDTPGTKSPVKSPSKGNIFSPRSTSPAHILSPGVNSPSKQSYKSHGTNSPSKSLFKVSFMSPETNSTSKSMARPHKILSPGSKSPHKILSLGSKSPQKTVSPVTRSPHKILSPGTRSPQKILSPGTKSSHRILSPRIKSPHKIASSGTKSPHKIMSPGIKSPHKIMSPRRAGLSCSPLRQHKLVKTGDITWNIVDDSESETDLNDSLINKIAKSIGKIDLSRKTEYKKLYTSAISQSILCQKLLSLYGLVV